MDVDLWHLVRERAGHRCEYCRIHQDQDPFFTFPVDHIIAQQHRGATDESNLCLSCFRCNSRKGPNIASVDSESGELVPLFHPREDEWDDHFEWEGVFVRGKTPIGRATMDLLQMNAPEVLEIREALTANGESLC